MIDPQRLRKNTVDTLALLVERYPNIPIARILTDAGVEWRALTDEELARGLNQLLISYTQLEAAKLL